MEDEGFNSMENSNHSFFGITPDNEISFQALCPISIASVIVLYLVLNKR
jgi:hypothetical protein